MQLDIRLSGLFGVFLDDQEVTRFESVKVGALLAVLAAEAGRPQLRTSLAGLLWPGYPDTSALKSLRQALYSLRKTLDNSPCLKADHQSIILISGENCSIDILELERALNDARANPQAITGLSSAIEGYRGSFLEGFLLDDSPEFEAWILNRREHHDHQVLEAFSLLADWYEQQADFEQAETAMQKQLVIEPWREEAHRELMRILALRGKRSQALAQYEKLSRNLMDELSAKPSIETVQLYEQIRDGALEKEKLSSSRIPAPISIEPRHNLPHQVTSLVGRETQIAQIVELIAQHSLVSIVGSGGIGKTRIAVQVAYDSIHRYGDGVWLCSLVSLTDPDLAQPLLPAPWVFRLMPDRSR